MIRRRLGIFMLCTLFLFSVFTGCSTQNKQETSHNQEVADQKKNITIEAIEQQMQKLYDNNVEKVSINNRYGKDIALIEVKMKLAAGFYYMYNLTTGENYQLPIEMCYVDSTKIIDENNVVFDMTGSNSETSFIEPPYRLSFRKIVGDRKLEFIANKDKISFKLDDSITFGENIHDSYYLKDMRATLDGIQFSFKTSSGEPSVFPLITASYDKSNRELIIKAKNTKKENIDYFAKLITEKPNIYVDSISLKDDNSTVYIILKLNKDTTHYTAEVCEGSFVEIRFSNNK